MGFFGKLFGGEHKAPSQEAAHAHTKPLGDTHDENMFFGEHAAANERAAQEAKDAEALATAQNAIEAADQEPIAVDEEGNMAA